MKYENIDLELKYQLDKNTKLSNTLLLTASFGNIITLAIASGGRVNAMPVILIMILMKMALDTTNDWSGEQHEMLKQIKRNRLISRMAYVACIFNILCWIGLMLINYIGLVFIYN